jgi:hypothetical protein
LEIAISDEILSIIEWFKGGKIYVVYVKYNLPWG